MASKIAPFTLREMDICVKCGGEMPVGTPATWLREPERKGYYHPTCEAKDTLSSLVRIKVEAADSPLGYCWMRAGSVPAKALPDVNVVSGLNAPEVSGGMPRVLPATALLATPKIVEPAISGEGLLLNTLAQALMPALQKQIAQVVANQPRIVVNVYCPKPGDEVRALDLLSKELFLLDKVQTV